MNIRTDILRSACLLVYTALLFSFLPSASLAQQNGYTWRNAFIGGFGAMVTGLVKGSDGTLYMRTDVGGVYRWEPDPTTLGSGVWTPLNDALKLEERQYFACESFAVDPSNPDTLYYAGGTRLTGPSAIFKSTDRGDTWTQLTPAFPSQTPAPMAGNGDGRWVGERLAVDPNNSQKLLFGSRTQGLWISTNGGVNWSQVTGVPVGTTATVGSATLYGVHSVVFDPGAANTVYISVAGMGVYQSTTGAASNSFTLLGGTNSSTNPLRLNIRSATDRTLWCTTGTGIISYSGGVWTNRTPSGGARPFRGFGLKSGTTEIIAAEQQVQSGVVAKMYRSTDGGASWTQLTNTFTDEATYANPVASWQVRPSTFVYGDDGVIWGDNSNTTSLGGTVAWVGREVGYEEDVVVAVVAPPTGYKLLAGVMDQSGFAMDNGLTAWPTRRLNMTSGWNAYTWRMAYQETNPQNMLFLGGQGRYGGSGLNVCTSTNGGADWSRSSSFPTTLYPTYCAVSATNGQHMVVLSSADYSADNGATWQSAGANPGRYTTDGGVTWNTIGGLPAMPAYHFFVGCPKSLAADPVTGDTFYYFDQANGAVYRSTNGGATFSAVYTGSLFQTSPAVKRHHLKTRPGVAGDLWLSIDNDTATYQSNSRQTWEGLYHSTDGGVSWTKISTVNRAYAFGFGMPATGSSTNLLFLYGRTNGATTDSLYRSTNLGSTWMDIQDVNNRVGNFPDYIEGSRQTYGQVFVGTAGRGVIFGSYNFAYTSVVLSSSAPAVVESENFDYGGAGAAYYDEDAGNQGNASFRTGDDVDIDTTTDGGTGYCVNWTGHGEWLKYTVTVNTAGTYDVVVRLNTGFSNVHFHIENEQGVDLSGSVLIPNTGSWSWRNVTTAVTLPAGKQVLKFVFEDGDFLVNKMTFTHQ